MKMMKDEPLSLDGGLRSKDLFNHPHYVEERGKAERRTLDALTGRKGLTLIGNMKFSLLSAGTRTSSPCHIRRILPKGFLQEGCD